MVIQEEQACEDDDDMLGPRESGPPIESGLLAVDGILTASKAGADAIRRVQPALKLSLAADTNQKEHLLASGSVSCKARNSAQFEFPQAPPWEMNNQPGRNNSACNEQEGRGEHFATKLFAKGAPQTDFDEDEWNSQFAPFVEDKVAAAVVTGQTISNDQNRN